MSASPCSLVILAAGVGSRYGGLKQLDTFGPAGATLLDYAIFDALRAGFARVVLVVGPGLSDEFDARIVAPWRARVPIVLAPQMPDDLPPPHRVPTGRRKPWGTGHALHAARRHLDGPFALVNADDFYGRGAYAALHAALTDSGAADVDGRAAFAMVGYPLKATLSPHGSVSRGVCRCDDGGMLERIDEHTVIVLRDGEPVSEGPGRPPTPLDSESPVSMNAWGLTPAVFPALEAGLAEFLVRHGGTREAEFFLVDALQRMIDGGRAVVRVLPAADAWLGVTHAGDREPVDAALLALHRAGHYPERLHP